MTQKGTSVSLVIAREFDFYIFAATAATIVCNILIMNMLLCGSNVAEVAIILDFD
jgi:hypothetical protein